MFAVLLSCLQGSPLKDEPCSSSQHIPRTSGTRRCRGRDGTCGASAASSGDSSSSSAPPARRALPSQGKAPFYLHLSGVSSTHEGEAHPLRGRNSPAWLSGLVRRWKRLSQGSQGSAALCWLFALSLKLKNLSEEMSQLCLTPCRDTKTLWAFCPGESKAHQAPSCSGIIIVSCKHILRENVCEMLLAHKSSLVNKLSLEDEVSIRGGCSSQL